MSKDLKPKQRLGQTGASRRNRIIAWVVFSAIAGVGGFYGYRYATTETKVEVPVAKTRNAEFVIAVRTRGEIRSVSSLILSAPQVPGPRIVKIAESGRPIRKRRGRRRVRSGAAGTKLTRAQHHRSHRRLGNHPDQGIAPHGDRAGLNEPDDGAIQS